MAHIVVLGAGLGGAIMAYELKDQAEHIVGSEEGTPWDGFPYEDLLETLSSSPGAT